jgi:dTDP-4-amino-4,6-dideoxygalactose transaminase
MQFRDLKKQYTVLKDEIDNAILDVVASGAFINGRPIQELEKELAEYVGVKHCISCGNGTDALSLALKAWGIGSGDAVFVPDFTFFASTEVISAEGATPVFVDVDEKTFNMDAADLSAKIKKVKADGTYNPKVILTVDLFGLPADYLQIREIADEHNLLILEDAAQGFGGRIGEQKNGSFGDISTTSFFPAKPLGCYGDGGAVFTNNDEWAALVESLRVHGKGAFKYDNVRIGMNSRLDTIQAAVLKEKLNAFKSYELRDINKIAVKYSKLLDGKVAIPFVPENYTSSWAQYTIKLIDRVQRDNVQAALKEEGVPTMIYYPKPMHAQSAYNALNYTAGACPVTERLCDTVLSLPIHPYLSNNDIEFVVEKLLSSIS